MIPLPLLSKIFVLLLALCFPLFSEESSSLLYPLFSPPKNWEVAGPGSLAPKVKIGFFGKAKGSLPPSINLAVEPVQVDLPGYLKALQKLYELDKDSRWRNLGSFETKAGPAVLTSLDFTVDEEEMRVFQLVLMKNKTVYLLTAAAPKEQCPSYQKLFLESFRSLELLSDLSSVIQDQEKKARLEGKVKELLSSFKKSSWEAFQAFFLKEFKQQDTCWQVLFLDSIKQKAPSPR